MAKEVVPNETVLAAESFIYGARLANEKLGVPLVTLLFKYTSLFLGPEAMPRLPGMRLPAYAPAWYRRWLYRRVETTDGLERAAELIEAVDPTTVSPVA